jgi:hypothetical protein
MHLLELSALRICWRQAGAGAATELRPWIHPRKEENTYTVTSYCPEPGTETGLIGSFCGRDILRRR